TPANPSNGTAIATRTAAAWDLVAIVTGIPPATGVTTRTNNLQVPIFTRTAGGERSPPVFFCGGCAGSPVACAAAARLWWPHEKTSAAGRSAGAGAGLCRPGHGARCLCADLRRRHAAFQQLFA